jgi:hypothetical protein
MPIVSYLHQLFHPETCQAYIHGLRWKDRPLQCPRCQSYNVESREMLGVRPPVASPSPQDPCPDTTAEKWR